MKKFNTLYFLLLSFSALAQVDIQYPTELYSPQMHKPLLGFDFVRSHFPYILEQYPTGTNNSWETIRKYVTDKTDFSDDYYTETGIYDYDNASGWVPYLVAQYNISYNYTQKRITQLVRKNLYQQGSGNNKLRYRYVYSGSDNVPDSEIVELSATLTTDNYSPFKRTAFVHNGQQKLIARHSRMEATPGMVLSTYYAYNGAGMLETEWLIRNSSGQEDSISRVSYAYDGIGGPYLVSILYEEYLAATATWRVTQKIEYDRNFSGLITHSVIRQKNTNDVLVPRYEHWYLQSTNDFRLLQMNSLEVSLTNGDTSRKRMNFYYSQSGTGSYAHVYDWVNGDYDTIPTSRLLFDLPTSAQHPQLTQRFTVYPNPAKTWVRIEGAELKEFRVFDLAGRELMFGTQDQVQENSINLQALPAGLYLLSINGTAPLKLCLQ